MEKVSIGNSDSSANFRKDVVMGYDKCYSSLFYHGLNIYKIVFAVEPVPANRCFNSR